MAKKTFELSERLSKLTPYQRWEFCIHELDYVYYLHINTKEKGMGDFTAIAESFKDAEGNFCVSVGDHIRYRYEVKDILGHGGFGRVFQCYDHKKNNYVAIKITPVMKMQCLEIRNEFKMIKYIYENSQSPKEHIVDVYSNFVFRGFEFIVMELFETDLKQFIKFNWRYGMPESNIKVIITSLLKALQQLHSIDVVHADLKPGNLAVVNNNNVKLFDFGVSSQEENLTGRMVQTRCYRAPEVILHLSLDKSIDIWSVGCITFELHNGRNLFNVEKNIYAIPVICEVLGPPSRELAREWRDASTQAYRYFSRYGVPRFTETAHPKIWTFLKNEVVSPSAAYVDFLLKCLQWDPKKRMSCEKALSHRWLQPMPDNIDTSAINTKYPALSLKRCQSCPSLFVYKNSTSDVAKPPNMRRRNSF